MTAATTKSTFLSSFLTRGLRSASRAASLPLALLFTSLGGAALAQPPTIVPIQVDGSFDDWQSVVVNPVNTIRDGDGARLGCLGATDLDCPVQSTGRDLRLFAWTYDPIYLYVYVVRQGSSSNTETFWHYLDVNGNGLMETNEPVFRVRFKGSSGTTLNDVYHYIALNPGGDPLTDAAGNADGYTLPGNLDPGAIWSENAPNGGGVSGTAFEERVPWGVLGASPGAPVRFHVSSSNSPNPGNVASQIDDNLGNVGGSTFGFVQVEIGPDHSGTTAGGSPLHYAHDVTNTGTLPASFSLKVRSSEGLPVLVYSDPDGDGVGNQLIARDQNGDGDFNDAGDSITAGFDGNGDNFPDTPVLAPGATFPIVIELPTQPGQVDVTDILSILAYLASNPLIADTATDTSGIGPVVVRFDQSHGTLPGQSVDFPFQVCNNAGADTFDLRSVSTSGVDTSLYSDPDCDGVANQLLARDTNGNGTWETVSAGDSDRDGLPDTGLLSGGQCRCFVLRMSPPAGTAVGTIDVATVTAVGSTPASHGSADLTTLVAGPIDISPDYRAADGTGKISGSGKPVFFPHVTTNNQPFADIVDYGSANSLGWRVTVWSDPNGDGLIADGQRITHSGTIPPFGGTESFVVQVDIPEGATPGVVSTTTVIGASRTDRRNADLVTDELTVSILSAYSDSLFTQQTTYFAPCDTIYIEGTGLTPPRPNNPDPYDLFFFDAHDNEVRMHDLFIPDPQGAATDVYTIQVGDAAGTWHIELRTDDGDVAAQLTIEVEPNGQFTSLTTDSGNYPLSGSDVTISTMLRNGNVGAGFGSGTLEHVVIDPTGTKYLVSGNPSTFVPYTGTELTRSASVPPLDVGDTFGDSFTLRNVTFPTQGIYEVIATWRASCGTVLGTSTVKFVAGSLVEDCTNGSDDDGDTLVDCADPECFLNPACHESDCNDGVDNDGDTLTDCADPDCATSPDCPEVACADGVDNDLDGLTDCADPDCANDPACIETACNDGVDNDGDGLVDCGDPDCANAPNCLPEVDCDDLIDNDVDTRIDCADTDCANEPVCQDDDPDGDTVPTSEDCAPLDPGAHHVPDEVTRLDVHKSGFGGSTVAVITWTNMGPQAGSATVYDMAGGRISELWQDRGLLDGDRDGTSIGCLSLGRTSRTLTDTRRSLPSDGFYYLVRARNVCGYGTYGTDSRGVPRSTPDGPCGTP